MIPGFEGSVNPFYANTLDRSIAEGWWTKLFPDAFRDDFVDVTERIVGAEFPNLFEATVVVYDQDDGTKKRNVNTYTTACLTLRNKVHNRNGHSREGREHSVYSVHSIDRGLYCVSKSMIELLERYFDSVHDL